MPSAGEVPAGPTGMVPPQGGGRGIYGAAAPPEPPAPKPPASRKKLLLITAGAAVATLLAATGVALAVNAAGDDRRTGGGALPSSSAGATSSPSNTTTEPVVPADEQCTDAIKNNSRWVCLTKATFDGQKITIEYEANFAGASPNVNGGFHLHIYGGDGTDPPDSIMGAQARGNAGNWYVEDENPSVRTASSQDFREAIGEDAKKVCARIADRRHNLVPDKSGGFATGNCVPITRS